MFNFRLFSKSVVGLIMFLATVSAVTSNAQTFAGVSIYRTDSAGDLPLSPRLARGLQTDSATVAPEKPAQIRGGAPAADADIDPAFNAGVSEGFGYVEDTIIQPDGKIIIGGSFSSINGAPRSYLARLNADGSADSTFNPGGSGPSGAVLALARQSDGKILIGGNGGFYNGAFRGLVTRLNADGTPDLTFNAGSSANSTIETIAVQPDGKILIGGFFSTFNGVSRSRIARLNPDGSLDATFNPGTGFNNPVFSIVPQPDGKILAGGAFRIYNGSTVSALARLNPDGSLDTTFNAGGAGASSTIDTIVLQADGKILAGGVFTSFNNTSTPLGIVRLNPNGTVENAFVLPGLTGAVSAIALLPNGAILAGGMFTSGSETSRGIALLNAPLGTSFVTSSANGDILNLTVLPNGKILASGSFTQFNNEEHRRLVQLNADGTIDNGFAVSVNTAGIVYRIVPLKDGKILVAGDFELVNGAPRSRLVRLNADGSLDTTFKTGSGANATIISLEVQPDGRILIGGGFTGYNGAARNRIARLNADGSLDTTFNSTLGFITYDIAVQPDGKILLAGATTAETNSFRGSVVRLNVDGSPDASFVTDRTISGTARQVELQPDGKILLGGFIATSSITINPGSFSLFTIIRLNPNGSLDSTFSTSPASLTSGSNIEVISVLPDGKILIGGTLVSSSNEFRGVLRLLPNGTVDQSFDAAATANGTVRALLVQPDGKILIGGFFSNRIARINADGTRDTGFSASADNFVDDFAIQSDGKILVGGAFTVLNNTRRLGIARLQGSAALKSQRTMFDYDGDGKSDISLFRPSDRVWYIANSSGAVNYTQFGLSTDKIVPADYDGDGKTDIAVYRPETGVWFILKSSGGVQYVQFGLAEDYPMPADYNGDGKAEIAVFRPSTGLWFIYNDQSGQYSSVQFGISEDKPVAADYNGDGKAEIAVYRPSSGLWFIYNSDTRQYTTTAFGVSTDKPVQADYDGDGRTDIAVYRPAEGKWYISGTTSGYTVIRFGLSTDKPVQADYDGDGRTDIAVYRPNEGNWYQLKSRDGFGIVRFGLDTDKPTPNAFVY